MKHMKKFRPLVGLFLSLAVLLCLCACSVESTAAPAPGEEIKKTEDKAPFISPYTPDKKERQLAQLLNGDLFFLFDFSAEGFRSLTISCDVYEKGQLLSDANVPPFRFSAEDMSEGKIAVSFQLPEYSVSAAVENSSGRHSAELPLGPLFGAGFGSTGSPITASLSITEGEELVFFAIHADDDELISLAPDASAEELENIEMAYIFKCCFEK